MESLSLSVYNKLPESSRANPIRFLPSYELCYSHIYKSFDIQWLLPLLFVILVAVYQEVTILFSRSRCMETVLICKCFMQHSNVAHKLNLQR